MHHFAYKDGVLHAEDVNLHFLAEDVGKNLDMVLDTIQRALFSRRQR